MLAVVALFVRSIRQHTRHGGTYLLRAGLGCCVVGALVATQAAASFVGAAGLLFLQIVLFLNYFYLGLAGCSFFAAAITEEKEEGTLSLLRMTNLNALSILLGKSTSRLCAILLLFAVQIPFVMLSVTMGGVSISRVLSAYALLALFAFSSANLALFCSVIYRRVWSASVASLVAIVTGGLVLPGVYTWGVSFSPVQGITSSNPARYEQFAAVDQWLRAVSPLGHLQQIATGSAWQSHLAANVGAHITVGLLFFLLAWWMFDRRCQWEFDPPAPAGARRLRSSSISAMGGRRPWASAIAWKDFHFQYGGWPLVLARISIYFFGASLVIFGAWEVWKVSRVGVAQGLITTGIWILSVELAVIAALLWSREYWDHTLGSLVSLPRPLGAISGEKLRGALPALIPSLALTISGLLIGGPAWAKQYVGTLFGDSATPVAALEGGGIFGLLRSVCETAFYLTLVIQLSLRLRWAALPAAYGIATAISIAGYTFSFTVAVFLQQTATRVPGGAANWQSNAFAVQSLLMATVYAAAAVYLYRLNHKLILSRAGES